MSIVTNQLTPNIVEKILYSRGVWELNLNYDTNKINDIVNQVYNLEKEAYSSSTGRTFIQKKGFHSENLIKVPFFKPIINDILKLVNNELATILKRKDINDLVRCDILKECFKNINVLSKFYKFKCIYGQNKSIELDLIQL